MCLLIQSIVSVATEVLGWADPDKVTHRGLDGLGLGFLLFPVVHHLRHQDHHGDDEADPGADEDATQGVESYALTVVQHRAVRPQGGVPEPEPRLEVRGGDFFFKLDLLLRDSKYLSF